MKSILKIVGIIVLYMIPFCANASVYIEEPCDFDPKIEVAGCFLEYEDQVLMLHRQNNKPQGNLWATPAGKVDPQESPFDAVIRETYEETGFDISDKNPTYLGKFYFSNSDSDYVFHAFSCKLKEFPGQVKIAFKEHKGFTWVSPKDALEMPLLMDEDEFIKLIYEDVIQQSDG